MTEKEFSRKLRRGLGGAIVELKENPDRDKYRDIVLRCCLRDMSYELIIEGPKGHYLYSAICALDAKDYFEKIIIAKFLSHCSDDRLFCQLTAILSYYESDGSESARNAFRAKYKYFAAKNGNLARRRNLSEGLQWEEVAKQLLYVDGFAAFKRYSLDIGELFHRKPQKSRLYSYYLFRLEAEYLFGKKRTLAFLDKAYEKSAAVKALADSLKREELNRNAEPEKITAGAMLRRAREAALSETVHPMAIWRYSRHFMKYASADEVIGLARDILRENDETAKGLLLGVFRDKQFPLGAAPLLEYAQSANKILSENAIALLEEFKDKTIHDTAIKLLEEKGLDSRALRLLRKNYQKSDDNIIHKLIKKVSSVIPNHVQMDIEAIYNHHRSADAIPILLHVYQKGECAHCRHNVLKAMKHCGVVPDNIIEECLYDSYEDTRKWVIRLKKSSCARS